MAQNITLLGATYNDVPAVDLPKSGGGTARFIDITESGTPVYDGTTTSDTKYDALFLETLASGVDTVNVGLDMDLLWTNSTPTSSFSAQTVSVDLSNYSFAYIDYRQVTTNTNYNSVILIRVGDSAEMFSRLGGYISMRYAEVATNGISFETGQRQTAFGSNTNDDTRSIPYKIYGVR